MIAAPPEEVWAAIRDVGAVHRRLAPGMVTDTSLDGDVRIVTFANGAVARELIVDIDDEARRLAYAVLEGSMNAVHHSASMQVISEGAEHSRFVWITDVFPHHLAERVRALVERGTDNIKQTLEQSATSSSY